MRRPGQVDLHGFLLGAGAFVRATELAQRTHKAGAFNGVAVALAVVWGLLQTLFGRASGEWRRGEPMRIVVGEETVADGATLPLFYENAGEKLKIIDPKVSERIAAYIEAAKQAATLDDPWTDEKE